MREVRKAAEHPGAEDIKVILCEEPLSLSACLNTQMIHLPQITDPCAIHSNLLWLVVIRDELITDIFSIISGIKENSNIIRIN